MCALRTGIKTLDSGFRRNDERVGCTVSGKPPLSVSPYTHLLVIPAKAGDALQRRKPVIQ
jgi:hypothetical protein